MSTLLDQSARTSAPARPQYLEMVLQTRLQAHQSQSSRQSGLAGLCKLWAVGAAVVLVVAGLVLRSPLLGIWAVGPVLLLAVLDACHRAASRQADRALEDLLLRLETADQKPVFRDGRELLSGNALKVGWKDAVMSFLAPSSLAYYAAVVALSGAAGYFHQLAGPSLTAGPAMVQRTAENADALSRSRMPNALPAARGPGARPIPGQPGVAIPGATGQGLPPGSMPMPPARPGLNPSGNGQVPPSPRNFVPQPNAPASNEPTPKAGMNGIPSGGGTSGGLGSGAGTTSPTSARGAGGSQPNGASPLEVQGNKIGARPGISTVGEQPANLGTGAPAAAPPQADGQGQSR